MRESYIKDVAKIGAVLEGKDRLVEYDEAWMNKKVKSKKTGRMVKVGSLDPGERAQYRPKAVQKPAHEHAAEALARLGLHKQASKVMKDPKSHGKVADWAENLNYHGIASMLRAGEDTDIETLAKGEKDHDAFDSGKKPRKYGSERDDALAAKYEATNPDKRTGDDKDAPNKWDAGRHLNTLRYLHANNMQHTDTYKRLKDKVNKHKDIYKKLHQDIVDGQKKDYEETRADAKIDPKKYRRSWINDLKTDHNITKKMGKEIGLE